MIGITKLACGGVTPGDALRYGRRSAALPAHLLRFAADKKPVVVWNTTRACNLHCVHCYADARARPSPGELTTAEGRKLLEDLAAFGVPVVLFSGGEPLLRPDLFELAAHARALGLRTVLSTNGTRIDRAAAERIRAVGFSYVGISLDGLEATHDRFRGLAGSFQAALEGIRQCKAVGQRVGLRLTLTRRNLAELDRICDLIEQEGIDRACFYHLVFSGRGGRLRSDALSPAETRAAVDLIIRRAEDWHRRGLEKDILTVDNHCDGVYIYLRLLQRDPGRAAEVLELLRYNGGNSSGIGIACVDYLGNVHPDQFWWHYSLGNVRERPFGEIWSDLSDPVLRGLRNRQPLLTGRCGQCRWLEICNGNFRVRAEAVHGDIWASDPACYLTDDEIGLPVAKVT